MTKDNKTLAGDGLTDDESDDAVIARAFRGSMIVLALTGVAVAGLYFWFTRPVQEARIEEATLEAPATAAPRTILPPDVAFTDVTREAGIDFVHSNGAYGERLLPETMGGGVAFFDYDNDSDPDLLFVDSGTWPWHDYPGDVEKEKGTVVLYQNDGAGRFTNVTKDVGLAVGAYGIGVAIGDYDNDGYRDIYISAVGQNQLLRNIGGKRFENVTDQAGVGGSGDAWSASAGFFDYDGDSDLDLFVSNYVRWSRDIDLAVDYQLAGIGRAYGPPTNYEGAHAYLFRNDGGRFTDVSADAGVAVSNPATGAAAGKGLALMPGDLDADGDIDIVVANDTVQNFYFQNRGDGSFDEIGARAGLAFDANGAATGAMGIDAAWLNDTNDLSVAIGNFANEMTSFYLAQGGALFTDEAIVSGVGPASRKALSFGLFFFDYDLDGRLDLFQANGHVENEINRVQASQQYAQPAQLFWNCGLDCPRQFMLVDAASAPAIATPAVGRGAAFADIDADGDLDVIMTQVGGAPRLLRNDQALGNNWIRLRLFGSGSNRDAIGAVVRLTSGGAVQQRIVMPTRSYLSQVELPLTFGLGGGTADRIEIRWPDGTQTVHTDLATGRVHELHQSPGG